MVASGGGAGGKGGGDCPIELASSPGFGVRGTKGLTYSKIHALRLRLWLAGLFLFLLIKNRCICLRTGTGNFLEPGCPGDSQLHRQSV